ncbi:MAG: efflux RND transporter periplasmic adaptor subunit [Planctomycetes bacterium]|nr:efflux RND transporter periplasmic adaptor subunit [Planctomycetota bacterium]
MSVPRAQRLVAALRAVGPAALAALAIVALMLWLAGTFTPQVPPGPPAAPPPPPPDVELIGVDLVSVPVVREVVGTIAAERERAVAARLLGRVEEVHASPGVAVAEGALLVRLEQAEHRARLEQAQAALRQAADRHDRLERERRAGTASEAQLVHARTELEAARAREEEARTVLSYTELRAPAAGTVIERLCEVGDTVTPGRTLVRLFDRLQLVATVPESLRQRLSVGDAVAVRIDALGDEECEGRIAEVVPEADPLSRAFRVKVTGPCHPGVIPGMFGRMRVPMGERHELRVPRSAVRRAGQVALVFRAVPDGGLLRQFVQTGAVVGDQVVVTSGLVEGDRIAADAARVPGRREAKR